MSAAEPPTQSAPPSKEPPTESREHGGEARPPFAIRCCNAPHAIASHTLRIGEAAGCTLRSVPHMHASTLCVANRHRLVGGVECACGCDRVKTITFRGGPQPGPADDADAHPSFTACRRSAQQPTYLTRELTTPRSRSSRALSSDDRYRKSWRLNVTFALE